MCGKDSHRAIQTTAQRSRVVAKPHAHGQHRSLDGCGRYRALEHPRCKACRRSAALIAAFTVERGGKHVLDSAIEGCVVGTRLQHKGEDEGVQDFVLAGQHVFYSASLLLVRMLS